MCTNDLHLTTLLLSDDAVLVSNNVMNHMSISSFRQYGNVQLCLGIHLIRDILLVKNEYKVPYK